MNCSDGVAFAKLHVKGNPLLLYNVWDAASARAVLEAGAKALATSSWSVAEAQGYRDGEAIPLDLVVQVVARITETTDAPVTVDFEGGYSDDDKKLVGNVLRLLRLGVAGINFEDRVVGGSGLYDIDRQSERIAALRKAADHKEIELFINARTDLFLGRKGNPADAVEQALERSRAYARAGASGFFIPGLKDEALIGKICDQSPMPVNVMVMRGVPSNARLAELGVARISYGALPHIDSMKALKKAARKLYAD